MAAGTPGGAPPPQLLGSCERIASRSPGRAARKRRTSSSINVVLPDPPGPVMPITRGARVVLRRIEGEDRMTLSTEVSMRAMSVSLGDSRAFGREQIEGGLLYAR